MHANEFLFLTVSRGAAAVTALHDKLYTRSFAPHLRRDMPYEPHITLARYDSLPRLEAAFGEAEEVFGGEFSGVIRALTLLSVERDGRIEALKSISLHTA
jgi:2'-5' RNA ligase